MKLKIGFLLLTCLCLAILPACGGEDDYYDDEESEDAEFQDDEWDEEDEPYNSDDLSFDELMTTELAIQFVPDELPEILHETFSQYVRVFGVHILATEEMSEAEVNHVAGVLAQYLDNDMDGQPDNIAVVEALIENQAGMLLFPTEDDFDESPLGEEDPPDEMILQTVFSRDIVPNAQEKDEFDATTEEALHLITQAGYAFAYPEVFGEEPGTAVGDAMDRARGGQFMEVPDEYPEDAWYTYYDETCEYNCMVAEYIYWALTSMLGGQEQNGRLEEIGEEWRLNTRQKVEAQDPAIYALLTNPEYNFATILPDGNYRPK